jgi:hypothetical protein
VPKIYAYDSSLTNSVGSPYMLQEVVSMPSTTSLGGFPHSISAKIKGDVLAEHWNGMNIEQRGAIVKSLGMVLGELMSINLDGYGSLKPTMDATDSILGPLVEPIRSLHRDYTLTEAGPWSASESGAPFLALATRELHWLMSAPGRQLFEEWRGSSYPQEDRSKTLPAFLQLARILVQVIPHMYSLFPLPQGACRPAMSHADFHYSNVLVSREDPTVITGVIDWEFTASLPLWAAYSVPWKIDDYGDKYEADSEFRKVKAQLRDLHGQAVVEACPDAAVVVQSQVERTKRSIRGLHALETIATSGVALYKSCEEVRGLLVELRQCVCTNDVPGVEMLDSLIALFSSFA